MSMSRKDFELLARTLENTRYAQPFAGGKELLVDEVSKRIATALDGHSSSFDKGRFLKACGVKE